MGYYLIDKYYVFYFQEKFAEIDTPFLEKLDVFDTIGINVLDMNNKPNELYLELERLHVELLLKEFKFLSIKDFVEKWVKFDFEGSSASRMSWDILYDYFHISGKGKLIDMRDYGSQIEDDYSGLNRLYPQGKTVGLKFNIESKRNSFWNKVFRKYNSSVIKSINLESIERIYGTLESFVVQTERGELYFGNEIIF